jgi:hypothetical protein
LTRIVSHITNPEAEKLIKNVQLVLFGEGLASLSVDFNEPYAAIWQEIIRLM